MVQIVYLEDGELMIDNQSQQSHGSQQKLNAKGVVVAVVSGPELKINQIHRGE